MKTKKLKEMAIDIISPKIMKNNLKLPTTHEMCSVLSKVFYDGNAELEVFAFDQNAFAIKHDSKSLLRYYGEWIQAFCELGHCNKVFIKDI